jgi:voltage-gated sodium channel
VSQVAPAGKVPLGVHGTFSKGDAILGLETSPRLMADWGYWLSTADRAILMVFVAEIGLRLFVPRLAYFRDPWNVFDFAVVAIALVPASGPLAVLRALRLMRVLRLITLVPSMKRGVGGLLAALPSLGSTVAIISIIFCFAAVIATELFSARFPELFGEIGKSAFTLFQGMTLEGWAMEVVRPVMAVYPSSWLFVLASTFTLLNVFIEVIVNAIQQEGGDERCDTTADEVARLRIEIPAPHSHIAPMRKPSPCAARRR